MARRYEVFQVDAFTRSKFAGNPAGVVLGADGLSEVEMQKIARELNNSETAFVFDSPIRKEGEAYDVQVRFFTPTKEVPICGHATISAHYVRAMVNGMTTSRVYHKTGAGILPVDVIQEDGDYRIVMTQGSIEFGACLEGDELRILLDALELQEADLYGDRPVQIVSTGHSKVMVGIMSLEKLHSLSPDHQKLARLSDRIGCNGYYVHVIDEAGYAEDGVLVHGRMFAPAIGILEDPVTGNANGPLGAYLVHHGLVPLQGDAFFFDAIQGEAMGRPGTIGVEVSVESGKPSLVKVSGNATIAFRTEIQLP